MSRQELIESLKESKLLSAEELEGANAILPQADSKTLAKALVNALILTSFQMDAVFHRRPEKLRIGNYDLLDKLGSDSTGTVFKARHRRMKRVVALKVLARKLCKNKTSVQHFQREVETIAQWSHPNIVMTYEADEAAAGHFLVMEFVDGQDLATVVEELGPRDVAEAIDYILQAARALAFVHEQGMIHRGLKPANLLRDGSGAIKVSDLGLARLSAGVDLNNNSVSQAGGVLATVDYMPPEQAVDPINLDHRSDIYSLGAILYYLLVGQPVYPGLTMMATLLKHRDEPIPSLSDACPRDVPAALDDLFRRMLAKSVEERIQSMADVVRELESLQATMEVPAPGAALNASLNVLLVEPSRTRASIVRKYLKSQHIEHVAVATAGHEALDLLRSDVPDVIISALYLADMTGVELAQQIHAKGQATVPGFVLISNDFESAEAGTLSKSGRAVLLAQPFTPEQLIKALSRVSGLMLAVVPVSPEQWGLSLVRPLVVGTLPTSATAPSATHRAY